MNQFDILELENTYEDTFEPRGFEVRCESIDRGITTFNYSHLELKKAIYLKEWLEKECIHVFNVSLKYIY